MNPSHSSRSALNPACVLGGYLSAVFIGGALIAPWVWTLVQQFLPGSAIALQPFRRYVDRSLLGLALLGLWPMVRSGLFPGWRSFGLVWSPTRRRELWTGMAGGMASLAVVAMVALGFGARTWNSGHPPIILISHGLRSVGAAVAVSLMEELLFRGMVFGSLRARFPFTPSALGSAALYAVVHFFRRPSAPDTIGPWTGLEMLGRMLAGLADPSQIFPGVLTLMAIGWLLAWCRERTGGLWLPLGLHAGWIFWFKSYTFFTTPVAGRVSQGWWWGSERLHDGWLTFGVIGLTTIWFVRWLGARADFGTDAGPKRGS
jgi:membrane protease YdiL (CAAX protease family)